MCMDRVEFRFVAALRRRRARQVFLFPLNLPGLKSHDHETWHIGPLNDVELHGQSAILIFGRVAPQAYTAYFCVHATYFCVHAA